MGQDQGMPTDLTKSVVQQYFASLRMVIEIAIQGGKVKDFHIPLTQDQLREITLGVLGHTEVGFCTVEGEPYFGMAGHRYSPSGIREEWGVGALLKCMLA